MTTKANQAVNNIMYEELVTEPKRSKCTESSNGITTDVIKRSSATLQDTEVVEEREQHAKEMKEQMEAVYKMMERGKRKSQVQVPFEQHS